MVFTEKFEEIEFEIFKAFLKKYYVFFNFSIRSSGKDKTTIVWNNGYGEIEIEINENLNTAIAKALKLEFDKSNIKLNEVKVFRVDKIPFVLVPENGKLGKIYAPKGFKKFLINYFISGKLEYGFFEDLNKLWILLRKNEF